MSYRLPLFREVPCPTPTARRTERALLYRRESSTVPDGTRGGQRSYRRQVRAPVILRSIPSKPRAPGI